MTLLPRTTHTDLAQVSAISRGDQSRTLRYLNQFVQLMNERLDPLQQALEVQDRPALRKVIHSMRPQMEFFGVNAIVKDAQKIDHEYETMPWEQLKPMADEIVSVLRSAVVEIEEVIAEHF